MSDTKKPARPAVYTMLTKSRSLAVVPREGNHLAKAAQTVGYPIGYVPGVLFELFAVPCWNTVRNTHVARGIERGWVEGRAQVVQARAALDINTIKTPEEIRDMALENGATEAEVAKASRLRLGMLAVRRPVWETATRNEAMEEGLIAPDASMISRQLSGMEI